MNQRLANEGHQIVGIEFCRIAVEQFFSENNLKFGLRDAGDFKLYTVRKNIVIMNTIVISYLFLFFYFKIQLTHTLVCDVAMYYHRAGKPTV